MKELSEELAEETGLSKANLAGSIRFRVYRYFSKEERSKFKQERKFHKNKKSKV